MRGGGRGEGGGGVCELDRDMTGLCVISVRTTPKWDDHLRSPKLTL